jgi:RNA polymerase sigma factor (sigma-70 family)
MTDAEPTPPHAAAQLANLRGVSAVMRVYAHSMHPRTDDAALVRRMQTGDERAFEAIFKRHHAPLLSYCRHTLGNQAEGEDALQQAFIKAHQALLGGTVPRELRPWLYAVARNCCLTAIAARRPTTPLEEHTPALAGLVEEVHRREDLRELVAGIGRLPEDQRSALLLAELDDLDHRAIATVVDCEVSKVKALIYQARSALIAERDARETPCEEIREQLAVAHGGELRRGPLRRHLKLCVGCRDFQLAVNAQRQSLGIVLPVLPSAGLAAAILGHGAAHAVGAASVGGAGAGVAGTGGTGIAASGTATATTTVGAGTGGGTGLGALVGGGLVTKLAVGSAVVVLASAGAVTVHNRGARATANRTAPQWLAAVSTAGRRVPVTDVADANNGGSLAARSPASLHLLGGSGPIVTGPSTEPSGLGDVNPLLAPAAGTPTAGGAGALGSSGQPAAIPEQRKSGAGGDSQARAEHRAELVRHKALLRRKAALLRRRSLARRRALLRRETLLRREALLRQQRAERLRARREALEHRHRPAKSPTPKPVVTPTPTPSRAHHRETPPAPTPAPTTPTSTPVTTSAPAETTSTGNESKEVTSTKPHPKKHPVEEEKTKEKEKEKEQPPNLKAKPEVTGVDVQPTPTETETGGTRNAS